MNHHAKWLRAAVPILTNCGLVNIANTCEQAAAEIDRLQRHADNTITILPGEGPKVGDVCRHCGNKYLLAPGGSGIYHECHTGPSALGNDDHA